MVRAPAAGWGVLVASALAAALAPLPVQLGFAAIAIGVIGMAHGASDLAMVHVGARARFIVTYLAVAAGCLLWWLVVPAAALPLFLAASALHFGLEDAPDGNWAEKAARGIGMVAMPAVFHAGALGEILTIASGQPHLAAAAVAGLVVVGSIAAEFLVLLAAVRRDARLLAGTAALVALPPLVGFSVGFLVLHAWPQTVARAQALRCRDAAAYLRMIAPVLLAAVALFAVIAAAVSRVEPSGLRALFAGIAALATPHLLVTPWFRASTGRDVASPVLRQVQAR